MNLQPSIELHRIAVDYDEGLWHLDFRATNGTYAGGQEFYAFPGDFLAFVAALERFGGSVRDNAVFEYGKEGTSEFILLHAFIYSPTGQTAVEVRFSSSGRPPYDAHCRFFIRSEVAAINQLGRRLKQWLDDASQPLVWLAAG